MSKHEEACLASTYIYTQGYLYAQTPDTHAHAYIHTYMHANTHTCTMRAHIHAHACSHMFYILTTSLPVLPLLLLPSGLKFLL